MIRPESSEVVRRTQGATLLKAFEILGRIKESDPAGVAGSLELVFFFLSYFFFLTP